MANMANTGKTVQVVRWSSRKRQVVHAPAEPATGEMILPGPPFPPIVPQMGEGQFFPSLPQKMPILFHSGNKRQFKLCPRSVSNYQNQLVEAEKLFKKVTFLPDSTVPKILWTHDDVVAQALLSLSTQRVTKNGKGKEAHDCDLRIKSRKWVFINFNDVQARKGWGRKFPIRVARFEKQTEPDVVRKQNGVKQDWFLLVK